MYTNFRTPEFYEACVAAYNLTSGTNGDRYIQDYNGSLHCWSWRAKDSITRNIFAETVGLEDKELREEAIDLLSTGGKLTQTWLDKQPR